MLQQEVVTGGWYDPAGKGRWSEPPGGVQPPFPSLVFALDSPSGLKGPVNTHRPVLPQKAADDRHPYVG